MITLIRRSPARWNARSCRVAARRTPRRFRRRLHLGDSQIGSRLIQDQKREAILSRRTLTDRQWAIIGPLVPGKEGDRGRTGADNRLFLDAILWLARGASPWRDLPPELG
ncbi:transposase, partial [Roseovarius sp. TE539]|uniref:transposase n=1 Tax=Roseovarius sp. TE539 TaxID=2249812 RepID=UPI003857B88D